jgi:hypothetical protein
MRKHQEPVGVAGVMNSDDIEARVKNIDERTKRIEQILPTLATKDDVRGFATKEDLQAFATKEDLQAFATKEDLQAFATKEDLQAFATKEDLKAHPTRDEMTTAIREEGQLTRARFDAVAERIEQSVKVIAEGHEATKARVESRLSEFHGELSAHDRRIMKLEAASLKRR